MYSFVLREIRDGVLIPLPSLMERVPCDTITHWQFRDVTLNAGTPFGIPVRTFEERSRASPQGICVTSEEFSSFLRADIQVIDGCICGISKPNASNPLFCLECVDASQWEATTEDEHIASELEKRGWSRF